MPYVMQVKKQMLAFVTQGPKAPHTIGGKKSPSLITTLNVTLGAVTLACVGLHVGAMYDIAGGDFNWTDQDHLMTATNPGAASSGGIFVTASGSPGTLIKRGMISDPAFSTIFLPQG